MFPAGGRHLPPLGPLLAPAVGSPPETAELAPQPCLAEAQVVRLDLSSTS